MTPAETPRRALIYARGTDEEIEQQVTEAYALCRKHDQVVVGIVRERPGETRGYHDAHRMLRRGEADLIAVASSAVLPDLLESATGGLNGPWLRSLVRRAPSRRIRPMRREGGEA